MAEVTVKARGIVQGEAEGVAFVCRNAFSFLGDVDMNTGLVIARGHEHEGESIAGKVMIYPETKGSSGGCIVLMTLGKNGNKPAAIVLMSPADPNIVEGAILSGIPLICEPELELTSTIPHRTQVRVKSISGSEGAISWDNGNES